MNLEGVNCHELGKSESRIDFIEMLTLDANEFLRTKCVCKDQESLTPHTFCKDCFSNNKESLDKFVNSSNNEEILEDNAAEEAQDGGQSLTINQLSCKVNDNIISSGVKMSCESKDFNKGLLNGFNINGEVPIKRNNGRKQNNGDEIDHKYDISRSLLINNSENCGIDKGEKECEMSIDFQNINDCSHALETSTSANKDASDMNILSVADQSESCRCDAQSDKLPYMEDKPLPKTNESGVSERYNNDTFTTNNETSFNRSDYTTTETNLNLFANLDPKNASHPTSVLQDLLNPSSTSPNSSETAPSRHQQESSHGESCASRTSIETDGRWREQAPPPSCSRESAANVGVNDAFKRHFSQDNTSDNILLNDTKSDDSNSCLKSGSNASGDNKARLSCDVDDNPRVGKERHQHLSWGFRNGRLVFAESKSDLGGSRIQTEQVVDSSEESLKVSTKCHLVESHEKLGSDCYVKETFGQRQSIGESRVSAADDLELSNDHNSPKIEQVAGSAIEDNKCSTDGSHSNSLSKEICRDILYSKDINRRLEDSNSRIKYLEDKLKKAGLIDQNFELSESDNLKVNNDESSQNTGKCDELVVSDLIALDNKDNFKSVDASTKESCQCVNTTTENGKNDSLDNFSFSLKVDDTCISGSKGINKLNNESAELSESEKGKFENSDNFVASLTNLAKSHQYKLANSLHATNSEELNTEDSLNPKYIEYTDFQKEKDTGLDSNQNVVIKDYTEGEDLIPEDSHGLCEFNVNNFSGFSSFNANQPSGCYDEFIEDTSSDESCDCDDEQHFIVIRRMRGDGCTMVNEPDRTKHNPDRANLKSLLKKPGRAKDKKSNRVVFNENRNEFFDADYIILIREECDYDEDDDDGVCTCNQHEMVRLTCCEPNCNCQGYDGFEQTPQSPKFAPPIEFVDAVTLSPPEGYKDMEMMAASRGQARGAVCRECSATHEEDMEEEGKLKLFSCAY